MWNEQWGEPDSNTSAFQLQLFTRPTDYEILFRRLSKGNCDCQCQMNCEVNSSLMLCISIHAAKYKEVGMHEGTSK